MFAIALDLDLPKAACNTTFLYLFERVELEKLFGLLREWMIAQIADQDKDFDQLSCDGKTMRGSATRARAASKCVRSGLGAVADARFALRASPLAISETTAPAVDFSADADLITFLNAIPDGHFHREVRYKQWHLLHVAVIGILSHFRSSRIQKALAEPGLIQSLFTWRLRGAGRR